MSYDENQVSYEVLSKVGTRREFPMPKIFKRIIAIWNRLDFRVPLFAAVIAIFAAAAWAVSLYFPNLLPAKSTTISVAAKAEKLKAVPEPLELPQLRQLKEELNAIRSINEAERLQLKQQIQDLASQLQASRSPQSQPVTKKPIEPPKTLVKADPPPIVGPVLVPPKAAIVRDPFVRPPDISPVKPQPERPVQVATTLVNTATHTPRRSTVPAKPKQRGPKSFSLDIEDLKRNGYYEALKRR